MELDDLFRGLVRVELPRWAAAVLLKVLASADWDFLSEACGHSVPSCLVLAEGELRCQSSPVIFLRTFMSEWLQGIFLFFYNVKNFTTKIMS